MFGSFELMPRQCETEREVSDFFCFQGGWVHQWQLHHGLQSCQVGMVHASQMPQQLTPPGCGGRGTWTAELAYKAGNVDRFGFQHSTPERSWYEIHDPLVVVKRREIHLASVPAKKFIATGDQKNFQSERY